MYAEPQNHFQYNMLLPLITFWVPVSSTFHLSLFDLKDTAMQRQYCFAEGPACSVQEVHDLAGYENT